jgi:hypothetical protein
MRLLSFIDLHLVQDSPDRPVCFRLLGSNLEADPNFAQRRQTQRP